METRRFMEQLVPELTRNASVIRIDESEAIYRVTIAGTTGVEARCEVPREAAEAAAERSDSRGKVARVLKACADCTVAEVPDARG